MSHFFQKWAAFLLVFLLSHRTYLVHRFNIQIRNRIRRLFSTKNIIRLRSSQVTVSVRLQIEQRRLQAYGLRLCLQRRWLVCLRVRLHLTVIFFCTGNSGAVLRGLGAAPIQKSGSPVARKRSSRRWYFKGGICYCITRNAGASLSVVNFTPPSVSMALHCPPPVLASLEPPSYTQR